MSYGLQVSYCTGEVLKEDGKGEFLSYCSGQGGGGSLIGLIGVTSDDFIVSKRQQELECASSKDVW